MQLDVDPSAGGVAAGLDDPVGGELDARVESDRTAAEDQARARPRSVAGFVEQLVEMLKSRPDRS